jgi:hypothetical protein
MFSVFNSDLRLEGKSIKAPLEVKPTTSDVVAGL